jgi:hypothetical protein
MFSIATPWLVIAALSGSFVVLGVGAFLFQAGCALADVPGRGYFRSLGISCVAVVVCLPLAWILVRSVGQYDADPNAWFGGMRLVGLMVSLLLTWLVSAGIYAFFLAASVQKGLLISGVELLLMGLLAALVAAVVLVVLAFVQIIGQPPPSKLSALSSQPEQRRTAR